MAPVTNYLTNCSLLPHELVNNSFEEEFRCEM